MHWKRWLTVLVLVPILIVIIFKGGTFLFAVLTILVGLICLWEYFAIAFKDSSQPVPLFYSLWAYLTGSLILAAAAYVSWPGIVGAFLANVIGVAFFSVFHFRHSVQAPLDAVKQIFGLVYISLMLSFAILIRAGDQGPKWIFFVVWVIAWGDSGAFYVGSYFGRHKLCPSVSPKKTIEGAVGGLAANLIFGVIYKIVFLNSLSVGGCLLFSLTSPSVPGFACHA